MNPEDEEYLRRLEVAHREEQNQRLQLQSVQASSILQGQDNSNLIEFQLEMDTLLEKIEHMLRGHILRFDSKGSRWEVPKNSDYEIFNEFGVQEILRTLSMYLNKNTLLSNYDEETINWKVYDLGIELGDLIFMKYEEMGLDTDEKRKLYLMVVRQIVDSVHSAYLRALNGGERESLRTARTVTQNEPLGRMNNYQNIMPSRSSGISKILPWNWGRG